MRVGKLEKKKKPQQAAAPPRKKHRKSRLILHHIDAIGSSTNQRMPKKDPEREISENEEEDRGRRKGKRKMRDMGDDDGMGWDDGGGNAVMESEESVPAPEPVDQPLP